MASGALASGRAGRSSVEGADPARSPTPPAWAGRSRSPRRREHVALEVLVEPAVADVELPGIRVAPERVVEGEPSGARVPVHLQHPVQHVGRVERLRLGLREPRLARERDCVADDRPERLGQRADGPVRRHGRHPRRQVVADEDVARRGRRRGARC